MLRLSSQIRMLMLLVLSWSMAITQAATQEETMAKMADGNIITIKSVDTNNYLYIWPNNAWMYLALSATDPNEPGNQYQVETVSPGIFALKSVLNNKYISSMPFGSWPAWVPYANADTIGIDQQFTFEDGKYLKAINNGSYLRLSGGENVRFHGVFQVEGQWVPSVKNEASALEVTVISSPTPADDPAANQQIFDTILKDGAVVAIKFTIDGTYIVPSGSEFIVQTTTTANEDTHFVVTRGPNNTVGFKSIGDPQGRYMSNVPWIITPISTTFGAAEQFTLVDGKYLRAADGGFINLYWGNGTIRTHADDNGWVPATEANIDMTKAQLSFELVANSLAEYQPQPDPTQVFSQNVIDQTMQLAGQPSDQQITILGNLLTQAQQQNITQLTDEAQLRYKNAISDIFQQVNNDLTLLNQLKTVVQNAINSNLFTGQYLNELTQAILPAIDTEIARLQQEQAQAPMTAFSQNVIDQIMQLTVPPIKPFDQQITILGDLLTQAQQQGITQLTDEAQLRYKNAINDIFQQVNNDLTLLNQLKPVAQNAVNSNLFTGQYLNELTQAIIPAIDTEIARLQQEQAQTEQAAAQQAFLNQVNTTITSLAGQPFGAQVAALDSLLTQAGAQTLPILAPAQDAYKTKIDQLSSALPQDITLLNQYKTHLQAASTSPLLNALQQGMILNNIAAIDANIAQLQNQQNAAQAQADFVSLVTTTIANTAGQPFENQKTALDNLITQAAAQAHPILAPAQDAFYNKLTELVGSSNAYTLDQLNMLKTHLQAASTSPLLNPTQQGTIGNNIVTIDALIVQMQNEQERPEVTPPTTPPTEPAKTTKQPKKKKKTTKKKQGTKTTKKKQKKLTKTAGPTVIGRTITLAQPAKTTTQPKKKKQNVKKKKLNLRKKAVKK